jgi:raffinose/stachyose/melibiose transport system substrate-binding protein
MYTNTRLLKELGLAFPKTITELIGQGAKIKAKGLIPIAMDNKEGWKVQRCLLSALVERTAGKEWLDKAIKGNARFTDQEFIRALVAVKNLADAAMFSPDMNQSEYGTALGDFTNEKAVYMIDGSWQVVNLVSGLTAEQKEYVSLEMFPAIQGEKNPGTTSIVSDTGYAINAKLPDEKAALAWLCIWFYTGPEGSKIRLANGEMPSYKVETKDADLIVKKLITYMDGAAAGYTLDSAMDQSGIDASLQPLLKDMLSGKKSAADVGREYEAWVSANDSGRKKK